MSEFHIKERRAFILHPEGTETYTFHLEHDLAQSGNIMAGPVSSQISQEEGVDYDIYCSLLQADEYEMVEAEDPITHLVTLPAFSAIEDKEYVFNIFFTLEGEFIDWVLDSGKTDTEKKRARVVHKSNIGMPIKKIPE